MKNLPSLILYFYNLSPYIFSFITSIVYIFTFLNILLTIRKHIFFFPNLKIVFNHSIVINEYAIIYAEINNNSTERNVINSISLTHKGKKVSPILTSIDSFLESIETTSKADINHFFNRNSHLIQYLYSRNLKIEPMGTTSVLCIFRFDEKPTLKKLQWSKLSLQSLRKSISFFLGNRHFEQPHIYSREKPLYK